MTKNRQLIDEQAALQISVKQASKPPDVDVSQLKILPSNPGIKIYAMPTEPCWFFMHRGETNLMA